jgi:hypothetical protein
MYKGGIQHVTAGKTAGMLHDSEATAKKQADRFLDGDWQEDEFVDYRVFLAGLGR